MTASLAVHGEGSRLADAAEQQNWSTVQLLSQHHGDIDAPQADGTNALLWAAHHDNAAAVGLLLDRGADANSRNRYGITPLAEAALNGNAVIAARLLDAGADANGALSEGDTPLMIASRAGSAATVKVLLERGAQLGARDSWHGETALMWAAGENHAEVVRLLAKAGADLNVRALAFDWKDITILPFESQLPAGGLTALLQAARQNSVEAAVALLEAGADPNLKDPRGVSPLRVAISNGHLDVAKELVERGADLNEGALVQAVRYHTTPLIRPATNRQNGVTDSALIALMFAKGVKVDSVAAVAMPKREALASSGPPDVEPSETGLFLAAEAQDIEWMRLMLAQGADSNHATDKGGTPLMAAAGRLRKRAVMNAAVAIDQRPPAQRIEAVTLLLTHGADINAADATGMTALHALAGQGDDEMVRFLVERGARLDLKDTSNRTPLDVANAVQPIVPPSPFPPDPQLLHASTAALLRTLMAEAHVPVMPYVLPAPSRKTPAAGRAKIADGDAGQKKPVATVTAQQN